MGHFWLYMEAKRQEQQINKDQKGVDMSDGISDAYKTMRREVLDKIVEESQEMGLYDEPEDTRTEEEIRAQGVPKRRLTKGTKFDAGKPTTALLPSKPLLEIAKVLDYGALKYAPHNWRKGISYTRVLSAAQRHMWAWNDGETVDKETNLNHIAHAACNLLFLLEYQLSGMVEFDDRPKKGDE